MAAPAIHHKPGLAIALKLGAVFLFMVMGALVKFITDEVPPGQAVFFRSFCSLPIIAIWLWSRGQLKEGLIPSNLSGHVWRGVLGTTAMMLTFAGLGLLPLPEVTAIGYATPIFTVILAAIMLGERVRLVRLSAVALGLVGVLIVIWPRLAVGSDAIGSAASVGAIMVLIASLMRAFVQIHVRQLVKTDHTAAIVFYFSVTASLLSLASASLGWVTNLPVLTWVAPPMWVIWIMISTGVVGGIAQIMVTSSYRFAGASMLAPFDYSSMIFASIIGYVVFAEVPTWQMLLGAALVIAGGILIIWRERQLGVDRSKTKPNTPPSGTT